MPWKIIILIGLIPIAAYWLGRYFFYQKAHRRIGESDCRISVEDYAKKLDYHGNIPRALAGKRTAAALAEISLASAYEKLKSEHPQPVKIRQRADVLAQITPAMRIIITVFAMAVGRPATVCLAIAVIANALIAIMKFTSRPVAKHATERASALLRAARIPRAEDEQCIDQCIRSLSWK
jgi:hypothetical protein